MLWLRKSKKGFTLIELMVVVAIIGVLSLLGLRLYAGQQEKAKNAIVKANAGTIQTLIQAELADRSADDVWAGDSDIDDLFEKSGIFNPITNLAQDANGDGATAGVVYVKAYDSDDDEADADIVYFKINGTGADGETDVYDDNALTARR